MMDVVVDHAERNGLWNASLTRLGLLVLVLLILLGAFWPAGRSGHGLPLGQLTGTGCEVRTLRPLIPPPPGPRP